MGTEPQQRPEPQQRRRIDRLTVPDYLHGLEQRESPELRAMRDECREVEEELSYARRVLQAQLDIARSEAARRAGEIAQASGAALVANLPSILADPPVHGPRVARAVGLRIPTRSGNRPGDLDAPQPALARLPDLADADLADLIGWLSQQEQQVSRQRRTVLDHIDRIQAELVRRYRDGALSIDELVTPSHDGEGLADA